MEADPTFAVVGGPFCPTLDFVFAFWIMITFNTFLTLLFDIASVYLKIERHFLSVHDQYERICMSDSQEIWLKSKSVHIDHERIRNDAQLLYLYFFNF
jgi:hypothetical protein